MRYRIKQKLTSITATVILCLLSLIFLYPFVWMFFSTFKSNNEIMTPTRLIPQKMSIEYYQYGRDLISPYDLIEDKRAREQLDKAEKRIEAYKLKIVEENNPGEIKSLERRITLNEKRNEKLRKKLIKYEIVRSKSEAIKMIYENIDFYYYEVLLLSKADKVKSLRDEALMQRGKAEVLEEKANELESNAKEEHLLQAKRHVSIADKMEVEATEFRSLFRQIFTKSTLDNSHQVSETL